MKKSFKFCSIIAVLLLTISFGLIGCQASQKPKILSSKSWQNYYF